MKSELGEKIHSNLTSRLDNHVLIGQNRSFTGQQALDEIEVASSRIDGFSQICIAADSSCETVFLILAAIFKNKTVVPINPLQPRERILNSLLQLGKSLWIDPRLSVNIAPNSGKQPANHAYTDALYILFTSGSTGEPKGVLISEANLTNTLDWTGESFERPKSSVIGLAAPPYFDIGLFEVVASFYFGSTLVLLSDPKDPFRCLDEVCRFSVTSIFSAPSFFTQIARANLLERLDRKSSMRSIISGGDFLPLDTAAAWMETTKIQLINVWGPSETSVVNTAHKITEEDIQDVARGLHRSFPIGRPSHHMAIEVLDPEGIACPENLPGELVVSGPSVGIGYLNRAKNSGYVRRGGAPAFLTGDIGYADETGLIRLLGRSANLIKINGFRLDPREVEYWIERIVPESSACVVAVEVAPGTRLLVAGISLVDDSNLGTSDIRNALRNHIPPYMLPKKVFPLSNLPLNANGKIDRQKISQILEGLANASE